MNFYERMNQMNRQKQYDEVDQEEARIQAQKNAIFKAEEEARMKANNRKYTIKPGSAESSRVGAMYEGVPLGGRHKSRRHRRMKKSKKSKKSRKYRKSRRRH
jgi:hypothetical protein